MLKYAINTSIDLTICDCESKWNKDLGWTEEMYIGDVYKCELVDCPYEDAILSDFDYEDEGSADIVFNEERYLKRKEDSRLQELRNKRQPLLSAFDRYNIAVTRGIIQETNKEETDILVWYRLILDLDEEAINNPPECIKYFVN